MRKVLGGGMRQAGILAAAGIVALDKMITRLQEDHDHIHQIANGNNIIISASTAFLFIMYLQPLKIQNRKCSLWI